MIQDYLVGKNVRRVLLAWWSGLENEVVEQYSFVDDVTVTQAEREDVVTVDISYHQPRLQFQNTLSSWIVRNNSVYPVSPSDTLSAETTILRLPSYTDSYESLDGIFFAIHSDTLEEIVSKIFDVISQQETTDLEYDPWGKKLHITYQDKLILFHLDKSIDDQLDKLQDIQQYYADYDAVTRLDLWSSDHIIVK